MDGYARVNGQQGKRFDEMELQQPEFNVRQLELSDIGIRFAACLARRTFFAFGGDAFLVNGIDSAFGAFQRQTKNNLQSGLGDGSIWTRAVGDLLFRERLRQKFLRLERLYLRGGVVCGRILVFIPLAAVLELRKIERLQINGTIDVWDRICANVQVKFLAVSGKK